MQSLIWGLGMRGRYTIIHYQNLNEYSIEIHLCTNKIIVMLGI